MSGRSLQAPNQQQLKLERSEQGAKNISKYILDTQLARKKMNSFMTNIVILGTIAS